MDESRTSTPFLAIAASCPLASTPLQSVVRRRGLKWAGCSVRVGLWPGLPHGCHRVLSIMPRHGAFTVRFVIISPTLVPAAAARGGGGGQRRVRSSAETLTASAAAAFIALCGLPSSECIRPGACEWDDSADPALSATSRPPPGGRGEQ